MSRPAPAQVPLRVVVALGIVAAGFATGARAAATETETAADGLVTAQAAPPPATSDAVAWFPRLLLQSDAVVAHHGPDAPAIEDGSTRPGFYLRRARLGADAAAGFWRARLMVEAASRPEIAVVSPVPGAGTPSGGVAGLDPIAGEIGVGAPRATEAFVTLQPHKAFAVRAGSMRVPIGLSRQIDEGDLRLPERARVVVRATPDFRVGLAAAGDLGLLQYALGGYSAAPTFGSSFATGGALYVLRLGGEPVGPVGVAPQLRRRDDPWYRWWRFSTGISGFYAQLPGADELGLGGDAQFQWTRLCVTGELLWTRRQAADRLGFTVEPGVFVLPDRLELVARVEWLNDEIGPQSPADAWGAAVGATFYSPGLPVRVQAAYTVRRPSTGVERFSGWAVLRATFTL